MEPASPQKRLSQQSTRSIRPQEVQSILTNGVGSGSGSMPAEHVPSPTSTSSGRTSFQSHSRTLSTMSAATDVSGPRNNRFSLVFPIQPVNEVVREPSESPVRSAPTESIAATPLPADTNFLTAIAAQERRVLELKEDLQRAETELNRLKKQWATHEAQKKRNDARKVTKLQPLSTTSPVRGTVPDDDEDGANAWLQQEMERRKALLSGSRQSGRKVFSGSRHTRTLSLLSPAQPNGQQNVPFRPPRRDSISMNKGFRIESVNENAASLPRASTIPDVTKELAENRTSIPEKPADAPAMDKDLLFTSGKKMATDFRDGLWTFIEDLRQATVGDEATQIVPPGRPPPGPRRQSSNQTLQTAKRQGSRSSLRPSSRGSTVTAGSNDGKKLPSRSPVGRRAPDGRQNSVPENSPSLDVDGHHWQQNNGIATPATKRTPGQSRVSNTPTNDDSAWDMWDETSPSASGIDSRSSSVVSQTVSTPRTSGSAGEDNDNSKRDSSKRENIPWPAISKLGPARLRRTASHLMSEWEKSLTPSPGKEWRGEHDDYLGADAQTAIASAGDSRK